MFPEVFEKVEHLVGDRGSDLSALEGRSWDAVIDNSGQDVAWARASADLLAGPDCPGR
jgi:2'-hydroxyisoflavone reductase